ncbi:bifunctional glycosyltransferase/CDP-glycerol:glycerophosphate glycerophosphotransferase [Paenibacillus dendritiformis]|uniref:Galactosamine-containing minor teichoic acid biosynthesis protein n=1 Tax=Paenibacillus dendritiformis C454 TaxID=1131935 RepID=H3S9L7_9BACL|nr:glycosyltransferase [Paenibacillus dendritiformis]EHQ64135.1 galactosamine-containing minor teichoic acid biosynthesis protein [Paenibacillus dendritiformis C454]CAH8773274.1 CDP-glycerol glycerophosphotransferase family protein [Paenibacillus dendritiformis]
MSYDVSVIIPAYNVEKYISECLESLIQQTIGVDNIEILLINDGSTDSTLKIAEAYAAKYPSIRIFNHEKNLGTGAARNTGLAYAKSNYISFIDSDDFISLNTYEDVIEKMKENHVDIVIFEYEYYSASGNKYNRNPSAKLFDCEKIITDIMETPEIIFGTSVCNKIFRKSLLEGLAFSDSQMEDVLISTITTFRAKSLFVSNKCKYYYRKREDSNEKSKTDTYFLNKQNYIEHLHVNLQLNRLSFEYPKYKPLIDLFNASTTTPFIYNMIVNRVFSFKEQKDYYYKVKSLLKQIDEQIINKIESTYAQLIIRLVREKKYTNFLFSLLVEKAKSFLRKMICRGRKGYKLIDAGIAFLVSFCYRLHPHYQDVWLICERCDEAKDNGYHLFLYMRKFHPEKNVYYLINKKATNDYLKVQHLGNVVAYRSLKHKILFILASKIISAHKGRIEPWNYKFYMSTLGKIAGVTKSYVFLQHGITKDDVTEELGKKNTSFNLFITGAKPEYDYVTSYFGYEPSEVVYTGFARFDALHKRTEKKLLLLMPTWRKDLKSCGYKDFIRSQYYKVYQSLITNVYLTEWLEKHEFLLFFYLHYEMQEYGDYFSSSSKNIIIADKNSHDVQQLLLESKLLITDYSSVFFDFAYMEKPSIYYQFDEHDFFLTHYKKGYFDYKRDGFGPVVTSEKELVDYIFYLHENAFLLEDKYKDRIQGFFQLKDDKNCERIYEAINNISPPE